MISGFLAVLGWKMALYVVILAGAFVRLGVWKKRAQASDDALKAKALELNQTQNSLLTMAAQVTDWKAKAVIATSKTNAAQLEAADLNTQYEGKAQAALQATVPNASVMDYLRSEAHQ